MERKHTIWWWLGWILAPLGIFGGPIAIANFSSDLIEWRGPIGYLVNWWDAKISGPFGLALNQLLTRYELPNLTEWMVDYTVIGWLLLWSAIRAGQTTLNPIKWYQTPLLILMIPFWIIQWPIFLIVLLFQTIRTDWDKGRFFALQALSPFGVFLVLWGVNTFWA